METIKTCALNALASQFQAIALQLEATLLPMCRGKKDRRVQDAAIALIRLCEFAHTKIRDVDVADPENDLPMLTNSHVLRRLADWIDTPESLLPHVYEMIVGE